MSALFKAKGRRSCVAVDCNMRSGTNLLSTVRLFSFPKNPQRRRQWEIAVRRKDWKATNCSQLCNFHFITGKPSADPLHPDFVPSLFSYNAYSKSSNFSKYNKRTRRQKLSKPATKPNCKGRPSQDPTNPDYVPNLFSFNSTKLKPKPKRRKNAKNKLVSEAENLNDNCFEEMNVNLETSADDTIQIADLSEMEDKDPNMKTEMQHTITEINAAKDEHIDTISQSLHQSSAEDDEELFTVKIELDEAYTEIYALKRENGRLMEQIDSMSTKLGSLQGFASEMEKDFVNVKTELQQAYKEINALRGEKDELQKQLSSSTITNTILQDAAKLHYYTGLNSLKDFQSVLALICDIDSSVRIVPIETQMLIVLMKLKLNLMYADLAFRFQISRRTIRRLCGKIIPFLRAKLDSLVKCPINNALKKNIPQCYKNTVYEKLYGRLNRKLKSKAKDSEDEDSDEETMYSSL